MAQFRKPLPNNLQLLGGASVICAGMIYAIVQGFEEPQTVKPRLNGLQPDLSQTPGTHIPQLPTIPGQPLPATTLTVPTLPLKTPQSSSPPGIQGTTTPSKPVRIPTQPIPAIPSNLQPSLAFPKTPLTNPPSALSSRSPGTSQFANPVPSATQPNLQPGQLLPNLPDPLERYPNPEPETVPVSPPPVMTKSTNNPPPVSAYGTSSAANLKLSPSQFSETPVLNPAPPQGSQPLIEESPSPESTPNP